ncbi:hypothetical protein QEP77_20465 [Serratia sp. B1]|nr:hypothetical protein QEP77_20465 [Serratia sp. B1]
MRQGITFNLFKVSSLHAFEEEADTDETDTQTETLEQLRKKALQSSKQSGQRQQSDSKKSWFKRSEDVKNTCCGAPMASVKPATSRHHSRKGTASPTLNPITLNA